MSDPLAQALLDTWFGAALEGASHAQARNLLWFQASAQFDADLRDRFGNLPDRILAGELEAWKLDPYDALAGVIALDQIPRNIYRGTASAFAYDAAALAAAIDAVAKGYDLAIHPLQAVFMYLPFEHAEDCGMQARSTQLFGILRDRAPPELASLFDSYHDYADRHARVIGEFGRFPHRNEILGRLSTPAEEAYLLSGGQRF